MLEIAIKFTGEQYEVRMVWSETEANLPNNYNSALFQLYSRHGRFQREPNWKILNQQSIDTNVKKKLVKLLDRSELKRTFGKNGIGHSIQC